LPPILSNGLQHKAVINFYVRISAILEREKKKRMKYKIKMSTK